MMSINTRTVLSMMATIVLLALCAGCASSGVQRSADGSFEGAVTQVWEDGLRLSLDDGQTVLVDTWAVCGDNTPGSISIDDRITVYADHDLISYEARQILHADGQPACETVAVAAESQPVDALPQRNADGGFEGVVVRVWEDGLELQLDDGQSMRVDTWAVCGDSTTGAISTGDRITVYADRELLSYDAVRILNATGEPACASGASAEEILPVGESPQPNADGGFEGVVVRVWEDGLELKLDDGQSMIVDTWDVCGDNTAGAISTGDRITLDADREPSGYDAVRILNATGEPAC